MLQISYLCAKAKGESGEEVIIRCGQELKVSWGREGDDWYLTGEGERAVFRMRLSYAPEEKEP